MVLKTVLKLGLIILYYAGSEGAPMQRVEAEVAVSVSDLKKNPTAVMNDAGGAPVAILNHNRVIAYMVPAETFETMMEHLDDVRLAEIIKQRSGEVAIPVTLDDL
jgi:antitoxin StbD